jgi:hypothetical protein
MVKGYAIGIEDNLLVGADMMIFITDCLGQMVLVRDSLLLSIHNIYARRRYIAVGLYGESA